MIRLARPELGDEELRALERVLRSGWLTKGPEIEAFERELAARVGTSEAVAVASGTAALILALQVAGIGPGDEVIVPSFSYVATAHAVSLVGARPVLVDVAPDSWNIDPRAARAAITARTRGILAVDQLGLPAEVDRLERLKSATGEPLALVEDAACALGAARGGRACGAEVRLATVSFHPRKIITTGEGGAVLTGDEELATRLRRLRDHGRDSGGTFVEVAGNHRMSAMAAAIGRVQLARLDALLARRHELVERYLHRLDGHPSLRLQRAPAGFRHSYQTFAVELAGPSRDRVIAALRERGIEATIASGAIHLQPCYAHLGLQPGDLPVSARLAANGLALPLHTAMSLDDVDAVCDPLLAAVVHSS